MREGSKVRPIVLSLYRKFAWDVNIFVDFARLLILLAGKVVIAQKNVTLSKCSFSNAVEKRHG